MAEKQVVVKFLKRWNMYNAGEKAHFKEPVATFLIDKKIAERVGSVDVKPWKRPLTDLPPARLTDERH